jgi:hypothetical protein
MADDLDRLIEGLVDASAKVGVINDPANAIKAAAAEFGLGNSPRRSFLDPAAGAFEVSDKAADLLVTGGTREMLREASDDLADIVVENLMSNTPPPLAASTIAARQRRANPSTRTLVDTWDLVRAIDVAIGDEP